MSDEWIEWDGSCRPYAIVSRVRLRHGHEQDYDPDVAAACHWRHEGNAYDIVAYKELKQAPASLHDHRAEEQAYSGEQAALAAAGAAKTYEQLTGGPSDYYTVHVAKPIRQERPAYTAECGDIIEALGMTFNEGEAFKALWRSCSARTLGNGKPGSDAVYDGEKIAYYGNRVLAQRKGAS